MSNAQKLKWLRPILAVKVALTFLFWGLPMLLAPLFHLQLPGANLPDDPYYQTSLGAVILALGVAYWYAWKDPVQNTAILKAGVVDNGLVSLVSLYFILFRGLRDASILISAPLTIFFFIAFLLLMPKKEAA
jgi:hypothetical protein